MGSSLGIWLVRPEALAIAERLSRSIGGTVYKPWEANGESQKDQFAGVYRQHSAWLLVMATGIAVRFVQDLIQDKREDPACVVIDEGCRYVVALIGGHEGGANKLAFEVANELGAIPVVTTATEANKPLILGVGCRLGASADDIENAVLRALGKRELREVRELATIDLKAKEPGLLEFCARHSFPLRWFRKQEVQQRAWVTAPSPFVRDAIGVDGVCEPCALMASPRGRLILPKMALNGVTVAVVEDSILIGRED